MSLHQTYIEKANSNIEKLRTKVADNHWRLQYHVASQANWINDPNGFVFYDGEYHLFYQHHPYSAEWGPMHWGHVKSKDLANWEHLAIALAPSENYDQDGCFSGSAIEKDGKLYLMYTGNTWTGENRDTDLKQVQCLAVSEDGVNFQKLDQNPVISDVPEGNINPNHIRDPKVWKNGEHYYCVLGSKTNEETGQILLYRSSNLTDWEFLSIAAKGEGNFGFMWECPDVFHLDGKDVLVMSPQGVKPEGDLYHNLHQSGYVMGTLDYDSGILEHGNFELLDYGFDFYAPQTTVDDQGRRIMVAWMAMWESHMPEKEFDWAGAMTLPRELKLENGKIISKPVPELKALRGEVVQYENSTLKGEKKIPGISGNCYELEVIIQAKIATNFGLKLRVDEENDQETVLSYNVKEETLSFNRDKAGSGPGGIRKAPAQLKDGQLHLRIFVDKSSIEVFVHDGEQVITARIYPSEQATAVSFFADDEIELVTVKKWDINGSI
ncbi:glycoside hydrolase family 32 protein [Anaerobacillus sp. CMMVII]|uniref:glycoside hydrolase family 32 protein n=1 Tax=Anaerobacillus sp. CMMVII TaxID=2755588 RepID=UPI0021B8397E|nr:glycoside hydrolase family 32 protein [Anaerobacillus sp. CMMVII]MCT8137129.1 glycoside hydrolase family 32 protein [Anaerobacillus sp. CMMVII]